MNYKLRRIDPYWMKNPVIPIVAFVGTAAALVLVGVHQAVASIISGVVAGIAVVLATQPAITAVTLVLGLAGGLTEFGLSSSPDALAMPMGMRLLSSILFALFYAVLMDGVVLALAVLYNFFAGTAGWGGISLDMDAGEDEAEA